MQTYKPFIPHHINATTDHLAGNGGLGRYIFLPGSDGRAKEIAQHFHDVTIQAHPRGHHLYLGSLTMGTKKIDVATIASGMGCPSMEIILHELYHLGAKRFLRVGTAGSLQPDLVKMGDIINVSAAVRDEGTTIDYVPLAYPAISAFEFNAPVLHSAKKLGFLHQVHTGIVHCKSSFYAREFGAGPKSQENKGYIDMLSQCGVLASEMETAALFIQSQMYNHQLRSQGQGAKYRVLAGAILSILAVPPHDFAPPAIARSTIESLIQLAMETVKTLAQTEVIKASNFVPA
ncbi:MAG: nucleoside phosphorylase [Gammaproteobacteria bacterium]|nr:nucleoside phosphorylase [Gammaproteobacteria bacterium]